jgi:DNA-binding LytR/AlgR family response regulator
LLQSKEIVCFAIFNKGIRIYTKDKQYRVYGSLKQIEKMVDEKTYIRINKNQIINCEYISEISKNEVKLIDGIKINEKLLIPKGKLKEIKDKFHRFVLSSMR